jgi:hypothetical protein
MEANGQNSDSGSLPLMEEKSLGQLMDERALTPEGVAWEAQLQRAAQRLKERYSHMDFYKKKAAANPDFWMSLAASEPNLGLEH